VPFDWLYRPAFWDVAGTVGAWITDKLLAPAIVAVVFSTATNILLEHRKSKRDLDSKICDELRDDLRTLQQVAFAYWERRSRRDDAVVEAKIVGLQTEIFESLAVLAMEAGLKVVSIEDQAQVADLLTGGLFGSKRRSADPDRARTISAKLGEVRTSVAKARWGRLRRSGN